MPRWLAMWLVVTLRSPWVLNSCRLACRIRSRVLGFAAIDHSHCLAEIRVLPNCFPYTPAHCIERPGGGRLLFADGFYQGEVRSKIVHQAHQLEKRLWVSFDADLSRLDGSREAVLLR